VNGTVNFPPAVIHYLILIVEIKLIFSQINIGITCSI